MKGGPADVRRGPGMFLKVPFRDLSWQKVMSRVGETHVLVVKFTQSDELNTHDC